MHRLRTQSLDDDDIMSGMSRNSYLHNSFTASMNSDTESGGSISVRDMIRRYNSAAKKSGNIGINSNNSAASRSTTNLNSPMGPKGKLISKHQSHHMLPNIGKTTSSYNVSCGYNGSQTNLRRNNSIIDEEEQTPILNCCKDCSECACCQNRCRNIATSSKSTQNEPLCGTIVNHTEPSLDVLTKSEHSPLLNHQLEKQRTALDNNDEGIMQPMESSYHSKTTIAKTASGKIYLKITAYIIREGIVIYWVLVL